MFILKGDWIREKKNANFARTNCSRNPLSADSNPSHGTTRGPSGGRVPSPCTCNVIVGAKLLPIAIPVGDPLDLVDDQAEVETGRQRNNREERSPKHIKQQLKRGVEKEQKQTQRTENLQKLFDHQGNIISNFQQHLAVAEADMTRQKTCQQKQNLPATSSQSSSSSSFSTSLSASEGRWSASAELNVQITHRAVQCDIPSATDKDLVERIKQLGEEREALRTDVREQVQEKRFWQEKCRMVLEQIQSVQEKTKVGDNILSAEKDTMSKNCSKLSKELEDLKEQCTDHENCSQLKDSSSREIARLTNLAHSISKERNELQERVGYLQNRMQSHLEKFSQLKDELKVAVNERDAAFARLEAEFKNAQCLQADRDNWKERCNSALAELQYTHNFHEELGRVHASYQQEIERFQDEAATLRTALKTQGGEIAKREKETLVWQQRAEQFAVAVDEAQERMQAGMSELRLKLKSRDRIIEQQNERLIKMGQIEEDLITVSAGLKKAILAISNSCSCSSQGEGTSSTNCSGNISLNTGAGPSTCSCSINKPNLADCSTSTSENPVLSDSSTSTCENPFNLIDSSTSTSEITVSFTDSWTSTFENPVGTLESSTSTTEEADDSIEEEVEFQLDELLDSNMSLLDISTEKLSQLLKCAGDSRVKHIETQTDVTRESLLDGQTGRGDAGLQNLKLKLLGALASAEGSEHLLPSGREDEERLEIEIARRKSFEDSLKNRLKESASVSASVLTEILERVDDAVRSKNTMNEAGRFEILKRERSQVDLELRKVKSERHTLEVLLRKETSARSTVLERLAESESRVLNLTEKWKECLEQLECREVHFDEKIAEVRRKWEAEKAKSNSLERNIRNIEESLSRERSRTVLLEKEIVSQERILSEMTALSNLLRSTVSEKSKKYAEAVRTFRIVTLCLRKELIRHVRRIDAVSRSINIGNAEETRKYFIVRRAVSLKRLHGGTVRRRKNYSKRTVMRNIGSVLRRRVRQPIWHSVVFQESTDVNGDKAVKMANRKRRRRRRSFGLVFSELKKNVARLKSGRDKAVVMVDELAGKLAQLESENQDLREEKRSLEQKLVAEEERRASSVQRLTEELASVCDLNRQLKQQTRKFFPNCTGVSEMEVKLAGLKELKLEDKRKGMAPLRDEINRVRGDLEKERSRTLGARKEAAEFNNWFHALEDFVRNQPIGSGDREYPDYSEAGSTQVPKQRGSVKSKEAFAPSCPHQDATGCCPSPAPNRECPFCFLKMQEVNGSNVGWASRAVHLAHECARRINQQALNHHANLASLTALHQRDVAAIRDANSAALQRLQSKHQAELARVRREVRAELRAALQTEVRANMSAVVERSLAGMEHLHRAEMRKLTTTLSSPIKFRTGRNLSEIGQQEASFYPDLKNQICLRLPREFDQQHARQIALFRPNPEFGKWREADRKIWQLLFRKRKTKRIVFFVRDGVVEEREKLCQLSQELQAEREEANRLDIVLGGQWVALRTRQACLQAWASSGSDVDTNGVSEVY